MPIRKVYDGTQPRAKSSTKGVYRYSRRRAGVTVGWVPGDGSVMPKGKGRAGLKQSGWSPASARANANWLQSIDGEALEGLSGYALSLTLLEVPDTSDELKRALDTWWKRMRRAGALFQHGVLEWQLRKAPHVHCMVYFPAGDKTGGDLGVQHWLDLASRWGSQAQSQHAKPITRLEGWMVYAAKHAAKTAKCDQRSNEYRPPAWREKTGRVWWHHGPWPMAPVVSVDIDPGAAIELSARDKERLAQDRESQGDMELADKLRQRAYYLRHPEEAPEGSRPYPNFSAWEQPMPDMDRWVVLNEVMDKLA